jgi:hypothetical protein
MLTVIILLTAGTVTLAASIEGQPSDGQQFAWIKRAADVNRDGVKDFLVAAPYDSKRAHESGVCWILSGKDYSVLYTVYGSRSGQHFGTAAAIADIEVTKSILLSVSSIDLLDVANEADARGSVECGELKDGAFVVYHKFAGSIADGAAPLLGFGRSLVYDSLASGVLVGGYAGSAWFADVRKRELTPLQVRHVHTDLYDGACTYQSGVCDQVNALLYEKKVVIEGWSKGKSCAGQLTIDLRRIRVGRQSSSALSVRPLELGVSYEGLLGLASLDLGSTSGVILFHNQKSFTPIELLGSQLDVGANLDLGSGAFGRSVCLLDDLDGDHEADMVIGAPGSSRRMTSAELSDAGITGPGAVGRTAVGVAVLISRSALRVLEVIRGPTANDGSFGSAIEKVGDADGDGADDIAILSGYSWMGEYSEHPVDIVLYSPHKRQVIAELRLSDGQQPVRMK